MDDDLRLDRRRGQLAAALDALPATERRDLRVVARLLVTPGFRLEEPHDPGHDAGPDLARDRSPLALDRDARAGVLTDILTAFPMLLGTGDECAAAELTRIRPGLVHPMTGEPMALLDWVLRGGPSGPALEVLGTD